MRSNEYNLRLVWLTLLGIVAACALVFASNWLADKTTPAPGQPAFTGWDGR